MASTREDSVLVNLRALRSIEHDRQREEDDAARLREQQARQAIEEAERLRRAEAERLVRAAEDATRRAAEETARLEREDRLRLEEAERRARVEASMQLEEARLRMEIEAKAAHGPGRKPRGLIAAAVVVLLGVGGLGAFAYQKHLDGEKAEGLRMRAEATIAELEMIRAEREGVQKELLTANEERRKQLEKALEELRRKETVAEAAARSPSGKPKGKPNTKPGASKHAPALPPPVKLCPEKKPICEEWEKR